MKTQICTKCGTERELNEDNFETQAPGQFNRECKPCRNARLKNWRDGKLKKDPFYAHKKALRELYKTTKEWFDNKLESQSGHCALCPATDQTEGGKRLSVDHDHNCCPNKRTCGKCLRGLLCFNCNKKLGMLEKFLAQAKIVPKPGTWTEKALAYLKHYEDKAIEAYAATIPDISFIIGPGRPYILTNVQIP